MLFDPTISLTIPSIHDGTPLECRVYHPSHPPLHAAIIAHPYAPLGGSADDGLVELLGSRLLRAGYLVGTFNFRGAGRSGGRTSWTAAPETDDYISFIGFMACYIQTLSKSYGEALMLMAGYSYGAMITSRLPPLDELLGRFRAPAEGSRAAHIRSLAGLAGGEWTDMRPAYLLVSPLRGPATWVTSMTLREKDREPEGRKLVSNRTLAVFGDDDIFVPVTRLRSWAQIFATCEDSQFHYHEVRAAGHFWTRRKLALQNLMHVVDEWAGRLMDAEAA